MTTENPSPDIRALSERLLDPDLPHTDAVDIINQLHVRFYELTDISGNDMVIHNLAAVPTASGMALGLNHAAQCLLDYHRTIRFLRGLVSAIRDTQRARPGETVNIFYAGCGPYAPFISIVAPLFSANELQFSLLEINKHSLESAQRLISGLSLDVYVKDTYLADAVTFAVPDADTYDILYSETLDALLFRECYVPILANMLPQFPKTIKVIPNNVVLTAELLCEPAKGNTGRETIFDTKTTLNALSGELPDKFPARKISLKTSDNLSISHCILDTRVDIYGDLYLGRGDSSLTLPYEFTVPATPGHNTVEFSYQLKPTIGLIHKFTD